MAYTGTEGYAKCRAIWRMQLAEQEKQDRLRHQMEMLKQSNKKKKKNKKRK